MGEELPWHQYTDWPIKSSNFTSWLAAEHRCKQCQAYVPMVDSVAMHLQTLNAQVYCSNCTLSRELVRLKS